MPINNYIPNIHIPNIHKLYTDSSYDGLRGCGQCGCGFVPQTFSEKLATVLKPQTTDPKESAEGWKAIDSGDFN